jgi:hypothetical protein
MAGTYGRRAGGVGDQSTDSALLPGFGGWSLWAVGGFPSRRLAPAGPRLPCPGGAPHWKNDLDRAGGVWLPVVRDGELPSPGLAGAPAGGALSLAPIRSTGPMVMWWLDTVALVRPGPEARSLKATSPPLSSRSSSPEAGSSPWSSSSLVVPVGRGAPGRRGRLGRPSLRTRLLTVSGQSGVPAIEWSAG